MRALIAAAMMATAAPAGAVEITDLGFQRAGPPKTDHDLTVSFGSVCCGIDRQAYERVSAHVLASGLPEMAEVWGWGREGERTIGLRFADPADRDAFARELKALRTRLAASRPKPKGTAPDPAFEVRLTDAQTKS